MVTRLKPAAKRVASRASSSATVAALEQNGVYVCRESSRRELRRHPYHWNLFDKKGKLRKLVSELYKFKMGEYQL